MNIIKKTVVVLSIFVLTGSFMFAKEKSDNPFADTEPEINPKTNRPYNLEGVSVVIADYLPINAKSFL